jgi:signal transduction histidine kinase
VRQRAARLLHGLRPLPLTTLPFLRSGGHPVQPAPVQPAHPAQAAPLAAPGPAADRPPGHRWPFRYGWVDAAWLVFWAASLCAIVIFPRWETVPFHLIWISVTILYGFRVWGPRPTMWILIAVIVTTGAAISLVVWQAGVAVEELSEVPLMAAMFWAMVWHARRRLVADEERAQVGAENARLLTTQRRFLQDASHQLRTPITIALGHAELLASELAGSGRRDRDIQVVVGELARLRRLGERLLMIAAAEDPDFLRPEPVALDRFTMDVLRKWMPTAHRRWRLGRLDPVIVDADRERLGLAVDALLENAVRHTRDGDVIQLSVLAADDGAAARMIIADTGAGIPPAERDHIFDRFRSGSELGDGRRTGLGLALVRAVARAHGGEARVHSTPGSGSEFELMLPVTAPAAGPADALPGGPGGPPEPGNPGAAGPGGGTVPADAPSLPRQPGPGPAALEERWPGRTR